MARPRQYNHAWIKRLYNQGVSIKEITERVGCDRKTVRELVKPRARPTPIKLFGVRKLEPGAKPITVYLNKSQYSTVSKIADRSEISMGAVIRQFTDEGLLTHASK